MKKLLVVLHLVSLAVYSESVVSFEKTDLVYEVVSTSPDVSKKLPMIIALHYMGGSIETSREDYAQVPVAARIALLQGEYKLDEGFSWFPEGYYDMAPLEQNKITRQIADRVSGVLAELTKKYATQGRPIITGYSQGADIAHLLALHHGSQLGAIIPMGGRFKDEWIEGIHPARLLQGPAIMFHGNADEAVSIVYSKAAVAFYESKDIPAVLEEFKGVGHAYPDEMKRLFQDYVQMILSKPSID